MIVHYSHRIEDLVRALAETVAPPIGAAADAPLRPEIVSVQGRGMERWLSMELSKHFGVWANAEFPFPRSLITRAFDSLLGPQAPGSRSYEPEVLVWTIAGLLPGLLDRTAFAPLAEFLREDESGDRLLQLAAHLADLFDRYLVYRPELVARFESAADRADWQALLWREIVRRHGPGHLVARAGEFIAACERGAHEVAKLPPRASLFGLTTLPPLYVDVLRAMGRHCELHLFVLQCAKEPLSEAGSPLWRSLGGVGRDFHEVLASRAGRPDAELRDASLRQGSAAPPPSEPPANLLQALQASLYGKEPPARVRLDGSVGVHACYSAMREVEVLHDQLAALFEADPSLAPRDVVVMTPDIERYAPYVEAVFSAPGSGALRGERPRIPYRVADQKLRTTYEVVDAFWQLLDVLAGRVTASAVVDLLLVERVRRRFGFETQDLDRLLAWIRDAGIRWGVDADHRRDAGQPNVSENTWRLGLDRMLLGLAMGPDASGHEALFRGVLALADVEPGDAELLGRFIAFCEALFAHRRELAGEDQAGHELAALPLPVWRERLVGLLADLVDDADEGASQHAALRAGLDAIATAAEEAGFEEPVPLSALRRLLQAQLERGAPSHGFLAGGVTFCELVPMRSIPFQVTALLGMNDGEFPRSREPLGFDRIAQHPRPGDRSRREDDRYLFLEALVSTREVLIVTYLGRSVRDGEEKSPAVVVDELLEEIARLTGESTDVVREAVVTQHPLHPFSPRYFDGSGEGLFSFSGSDRRGAQARVRAQTAPRAPAPFVRQPLPQPADAERVVSVAELTRFFEHPVRAFLQRRLGLYLRDEVEAIRDREPLELDALERWQVGDRLLRALASGVPIDEALARLRAGGELPPGVPGDLVALDQLATAEALVAEVRALRGETGRPALEIDLFLETGAAGLPGWQVSGEVAELWAGGRVDFQLSKLPHRRELGFWIQHLLLCASGEALDSFLVGRNGAKGIGVVQLPPVAEPERWLRDLLQLYEQGLELPLPLLPTASRTQAQVRFEAELGGDGGGSTSGSDEGGWDPAPVDKARKDWEDGQGRPAEREDPFLAQAFRDVDPLDPAAPLPGGESFGALAERVYGPYLRARRVRE